VHTRKLLVPLALLVLAVTAAAITANASGKTPTYGGKQRKQPVGVTVFAPRKGDVAGKESKGFFVDLASATRASRRVAPTSS
jgi:hypothetical protein